MFFDAGGKNFHHIIFQGARPAFRHLAAAAVAGAEKQKSTSVSYLQTYPFIFCLSFVMVLWVMAFYRCYSMLLFLITELEMAACSSHFH